LVLKIVFYRGGNVVSPQLEALRKVFQIHQVLLCPLSFESTFVLYLDRQIRKDYLRAPARRLERLRRETRLSCHFLRED
jgi:hypothetical protein